MIKILRMNITLLCASVISVVTVLEVLKELAEFLITGVGA
jgi:hypothetical protein